MSPREQSAIQTRNLHRIFYSRQGVFRRGEPTVAVADVNLDVSVGTVYGLLGPNGAGKTTTIKMLSTLLVPTSGTARVAGYDVADEETEVRRRLGVLLGGDRGLYGKISAADNLRFFASLYGVSRSATEGRVQRLLDMSGLANRQDERVEGFSRGMKQRLHLARALIHDPEIVILDEPTIGLDPDAAVRLRNVVRELVPEKTVLLTTHYLAEADDLCDRIAIIDRGRIVAENTPIGIKKLVGSGSVLEITIGGEIRDTTFESIGFVVQPGAVRRIRCEGNGISRIEIASDQEHAAQRAVPILVADGYQVLEVRQREISLEEAFLSLTSRSGHDTAGVA